jgi:cytoskeletal protein RodZ
VTENSNIKDRSSVKGFGAKLKTEREARDVTLEEISRVTRVSLHLLRAMEEDRWEEVPGGIFSRNFIRLYANHLGLEAEKLVDEFRRFIDIKNQAETEKQDYPRKRQDADGSTNYSWMYVAFTATIVILIGGFILVNNISNQPESTSNEMNRVNETAGQIGEPEEAVQLDRTSEGESGIVSENQDSGLSVELIETSRERTWFQWRADGELKSPPDGENLLRNQARTLNADETIWLNITRLQSIELHINGTQRQWSEFSPDVRTNEDGSTISYIIQINKADLK